MRRLALAGGGTSVRPWTEDDVESLGRGINMTSTLAFKAAVELGRQHNRVSFPADVGTRQLRIDVLTMPTM